MNDEKVNQNDEAAADWVALGRAAEAVPEHPADYFVGLPEAAPALPGNILLFLRRGPFDAGQGTVHHRFVLALCLRGEATVIVDDRVARLAPHQAVLVAPHQFHHYADFEGADVRWLFVTFELPEGVELGCPRGRALTLTPLQRACLRLLVARYGALGGRVEPSPDITLALALVLQGFREGAPAGTPAAGVAPGRRLMQDVARYVHHHLAEPLEVSRIAQAVGLSGSHLRARFRALAGVGVGAYIRQARIHRAQVLMLSSDARLKEIAERCGYESLYAFSRAFRRAAGLSPSAYRKRFRA